jgi:hypothetical protein
VKALMERAERIASEAQQRKIDELAAWAAERLPRAEIEKFAAGFSIRELRIIERWLDEPDLRFLGSARR